MKKKKGAKKIGYGYAMTSAAYSGGSAGTYNSTYPTTTMMGGKKKKKK